MPQPRSAPRSPVVVGVVIVVAVVGAVASLLGCNRRVFEFVEPQCGATDLINVDVDDQRVDILLVVDNSGSMREEQDEIARNFLSDDCPIPASALADFARCDDDDRPAVCRFHNPSPEQLAVELAGCGFLQVLAAFDTDFRVGVITTDVGACDNRVSSQQGGASWGFHPQRGCLQPDQPFGARKVIARDDVDSDDPAVRDLGARFTATLDKIRTFGSPSERGLDAVDLFFADDTARDPSCGNDRDAFVRDDARLVLLFLTDEEDCSHADGGPFSCPAFLGDACTERFAEFGADVCGDNPQHHFSGANAACYDQREKLTPVSFYVDRFRALKADPGDITVAVIAGGVPDDDGRIVAGGCDVDDGGAPVGGCAPLAGRDRADCPECCLADGGGRYHELADAMFGIKESICLRSFKDAMINMAVFLVDTDVLRLSEPPSNAALILVHKNDALQPRLPGTACGDGDGWIVEEDLRSIRLCGSTRPGAGDRLTVRAALAGLCDQATGGISDAL